MSTWLLERKTTSEDITPGSTYWKRLTLDMQVSVYMLGAIDGLHLDPRGVLYDVIRKPQLRPYQPSSKRSEPETFEEYRTRCLAEIQSNPDAYYQRGKVVRLTEDMIEAMRDTWHTAAAIHASRRGLAWPRNPDRCHDWNRACDYWSVCAGEGQISDDLVFRSVPPMQPQNCPEERRHLPVLSQSAMRTYRACPRRYFYAHELRRRPHAQANALVSGRRIHKALEVYSISMANKAQTMSAVEHAMTEIPLTSHDAAREQAMLLGYVARYQDEPLTYKGLEVEFTAPLRSPLTRATSRTWQLGGYIDGIVEMPE